MRFAVLSLGLVIAAGSAFADEESIKVEDLPKAVRSAVKKKFPEGKLVSAAKEEEDGKTIFEVVVEDDDAKMDVAVSAKGKLLEVEKTIDAAKLPSEVTAAVEKKFPKAKIKKAEKVVKYEDEDDDEDEDEDEDDDVDKFFEVVLSVEGKKDFEVKISPKGKILKDDEDDDHEEKEEKGDKGKKKEKGDD
ncbi:PepSY-like domain-containing protein [Paludisphaera rhizosphaerae]|uniref:PepSY-like domain-containing protein n=1 Tax=Paludisphaera rhizosphaerae TaxID=2711216 RepID=UPI0013EC8A48|nr:PepSY-like domain-containing protein [Paludisphaera rhizosphaerae]